MMVSDCCRRHRLTCCCMFSPATLCTVREYANTVPRSSCWSAGMVGRTWYDNFESMYLSTSTVVLVQVQQVIIRFPITSFSSMHSTQDTYEYKVLELRERNCVPLDGEEIGHILKPAVLVLTGKARFSFLIHSSCEEYELVHQNTIALYSTLANYEIIIRHFHHFYSPVPPYRFCSSDSLDNAHGRCSRTPRTISP